MLVVVVDRFENMFRVSVIIIIVVLYIIKLSSEIIHNSTDEWCVEVMVGRGVIGYLLKY